MRCDPFFKCFSYFSAYFRRLDLVTFSLRNSQLTFSNSQKFRYKFADNIARNKVFTSSQDTDISIFAPFPPPPPTPVSPSSLPLSIHCFTRCTLYTQCNLAITQIKFFMEPYLKPYFNYPWFNPFTLTTIFNPR